MLDDSGYHNPVVQVFEWDRESGQYHSVAVLPVLPPDRYVQGESESSREDSSTLFVQEASPSKRIAEVTSRASGLLKLVVSMQSIGDLYPEGGALGKRLEESKKRRIALEGIQALLEEVDRRTLKLSLRIEAWDKSVR